MRTVLFCGNGLSGDILPKLAAGGLKFCVITEFPEDRGLESASAVVIANSKRPEEAVAAARNLYNSGWRFDGVLSLCWDCAESVSAIAAELGLRSVTRATAIKATNKALRSEAFAEFQVPAPRYSIADSLDEARALCVELGYPVVLKPVDKSSSKGIVLVHDASALDEAYAYSRRFSDDPRIIINEYLVGTEHSTEGLMIDGSLRPTGISDRIFADFGTDTFIEIGDVMPTRLPAELVAEAFRVTEQAALAVGIRDGVAKGDLLVVAGRGVLVLEIAARLGGPRYGTEMIPLSNGTNILVAAIQQATGDPIDPDNLSPKFERGMVNRSIFPKPGRVVSIEGIESLSAMPGFYDFKWWSPNGLKVGDAIAPYENGCGDVGYIIATGATREEALANADAIENRINISTAPC